MCIVFDVVVLSTMHVAVVLTPNRQSRETNQVYHHGTGHRPISTNRVPPVQGSFRQCSGCKSVCCCTTRCQKEHWPEHQVLCKAIKELTQSKEHCTKKGLGDSTDMSVFISHINPKQQFHVAKLVGRKCSLEC